MAPRKSPSRKPRNTPLVKAKNAYVAKRLAKLQKAHPRTKHATLMKQANAAWMKSPERRRLMAKRSPARRSPAKRNAKRSPAKRNAKRSPAKRSSLQAARARFMKQKRKQLQQQMPKAQPKTIQQRANAAWKRSPERKRMMAKRVAKRSPAKRSPAKRSPARRASAKRAAAARRRRTPLQISKAIFMKQKKEELRQNKPRAQAKTIQKLANAAWMRSPERKRLMAKPADLSSTPKISPAMKEQLKSTADSMKYDRVD